MATKDDVNAVGATAKTTSTEQIGATASALDVLDQKEAKGIDLSSDQMLGDILNMPQDANLVDFLARPVRINTFGWTAATTGSHIDPWALFLNDARVKEKLRGFSRLRGDLSIEILLNGTPFHAGSMLVAYEPCSGQALSADFDYYQHSQLPHVLLNPTTSGKKTLKVPYSSNRLWINLQDALGAEVGVLHYDAITALSVSNGGTPPTVTVTTFAWMEKPLLTVPTNLAIATFTGQVGYEGGGVVSRVASGVADVASWFKNIPIIGVFAQATEAAARGIGQGAGLLGFSNPLQIEPARHAKIIPVTQYPTSSGQDMSTPFSLDPKCELTIDNRMFGLHGEDELSVAYLRQIPSLLTQVTWTSTQVEGTVLANFPVTPALFPTLSGADIVPTALSGMTELFTFWTGELRYHLHVVASAYTKGRIRVSYVPSTAAAFDGDIYNLNYTKIIDISESSDYVFSVGWASFIPWLRCDYRWSAASYVYDEVHHNGSLVISVVNDMTAPVMPATVTIQVWVSGGDDFQFAGPRAIDPKMTYFAVPQSGTEPSDGSSNLTVEPLVPTMNRGKLNLISMGESIPSLRLLLKRTVPWGELPMVNDISIGGNTLMYQFCNVPRYPLMPGYTLSPYHWHNTSTGIAYNYVRMTPLTLVLPWFLGSRGSIRHRFRIKEGVRTFHPDTFSSAVQHAVTRWDYDEDNFDAASSYLANTGSDKPSQLAGSSYGGTGNINAAVTMYSQGGQEFEAGLQFAEIQLPDYNTLLYHVFGSELIQPNEVQVGAMYIARADTAQGVNYTPNQSWTAVISSCVGEDFNVVFFTGVPRYYTRTVPGSSTTYEVATDPVPMSYAA